MKRNIAPLLGIAFVVALAATGIFYGLFVGRLRDASAEAKNQKIVVARKTIDRGTKLGPDDVKLSNWAGALPPGAFQRVEDAVGQTVFSGLEQNEPITLSRLSDGSSNGGGASPIAKGMRAISVRVSESAGLIPFLRAGHHVDLQMVSYRDGQPLVKTLLRNIEVLSMGGEEAGPRGSALPIVNLLVTPSQADQLAMADSFAKVRILLRNQTETEGEELTASADAGRPKNGAAAKRESVATISSLLQKPVANAGSANEPSGAAATATANEQALAQYLSRIDFEVRVAGAELALVEQILPKLNSPPQPGDVQLAVLKKGERPEQLLKQLESQNLLQVVGSHAITGFAEKQLLVQAGNSWRSPNGNWCGLRVQVLPSVPTGKDGQPAKALKLRVQPEFVTPWNGGTTSRKVVADVDLADGQTLLLSGFSSAAELPGLLANMFPAKLKNAAHRDVWVLLTPRIRRAEGAPKSSAVVAKAAVSASPVAVSNLAIGNGAARKAAGHAR